jgi:hypothetical protein
MFVYVNCSIEGSGIGRVRKNVEMSAARLVGSTFCALSTHNVERRVGRA